MSRPCHVLSVVATLGLGGDENRLVSMVRSIDRSRFRFSVAVLPPADNHEEHFGNMRPLLESSGVPVYDVRDPKISARMPHRARAALRLMGRVRSLAQLVRNLKVDVIDARMDGGMIVGIPAAMLTGRPSVATLYDAVPWTRYPMWPLARAFTLNMTNAVITDSDARRRQLERWVWSPSTTTWLIPNGIPIPQPVRPAAAVREHLGFPADCGKVICQVAGIVPYKGQLVLVEAARKVVSRAPNSFFLIVGYCRGEHAYQRALADRICELKLQNRVRVVAYAGPIGDIWQLVDIHVHPSLFDSLPNAILEGMALGKPAAVTSVGGISEAVENERTGLVVPPNNSAALADALLRLLDNPEEARSLGAAAQTRYNERYRPESMAQALEGCFRSVVRSGS